jgi:hypothetical protein
LFEEPPMTKQDDTSGEITLVGGAIVYRVSGAGWTVNLSDVRIIGEYTTESGPFVDDYFLVFLTAEQSGWYEASLYATGLDRFLIELGVALGSPIRLALCGSTDWKTRALWPPAVVGEPLLTTVPRATRLGRLWQSITGQRDLVLSDAAKSLLLEG